jgi:hypothetical protein
VKGKKILNDGHLYGYSGSEWQSLHKSKRSRIRHPQNQKKAVEKWAKKQSPEYHRLRARKSQLKLMYGMTTECYDEMLKKQGGACGICKTSKPTGRWKVFAVDHCHATGKVRGLLCNECNRGIGLLKDSIEVLKSAVNYLEMP